MLDPSLILCENCGYTLDSLLDHAAHNPAAKCPECGKLIAESLPERRAGSAWQRQARFASWLGANFATLRHPVRRWGCVRIEKPSAYYLMIANIVFAAAAWALALSIDAMASLMETSRTIPTFVLANATLTLLTIIEWAGIRFFGWRRRWRINSPAAWAIVGHASVGWIVGGVFALLTIILARSLRWDGWGYTPGGRHGGSSYLTLALAAGAPIGLLTFETLVYLGFRQLRFANHPRSTIASTLAPRDT